MSRHKQLFFIVPIVMVVTAKTNAQELPLVNNMPIFNHSFVMPELEFPFLSNSLLLDSLQWKKEIMLNSISELRQREMRTMGNNSNIATGEMWKWRGGVLYVGNEDTEMLGLMHRQGVDVIAVKQYGGFTFSLMMSANLYILPIDGRLEILGMSARQNQFSIGGMVSYDFNENMSATVYGMYVSNPFYYSMAAYPYISTSAYGGYLSFHNNNVGLDLGVNKHYDPFARRWQTDPIVRPIFKIGKIKMGIEVGPAIKDGMMRLMHKPKKQGQMKMPRK